MKEKYKIIKLLRDSPTRKAYLAICDNQEDKKCVINQIIMNRTTEQEKRESFNEADILKKLDHPNIIKCKEIFLQRKPVEALTIVTEFVDGGDLGLKIESQKNIPFTESQILDYITQICLALQYIHNKKIIYKDLKSGNILLTKSGIVKLGDFGFVKAPMNFNTFTEKMIVENSYYLPPEIFSNNLYDSKSDVWALGVLLYELMTFKRPFYAESVNSLRNNKIRGKYKPPSDTYSSEIRDLLKKCNTLDPEKRPSINEILQLPLVKNRINNLLNEVQYDHELFKTMTEKCNEPKKKENNKEENKDTKTLNDKNKIKAFLNKKKAGKKNEEKKPLKNPDKNPLDNTISNSSINHTDKIINETNFLLPKKDPNFKPQKIYKEEDIGQILKSKGYLDLLDEKSGNFDANKMNEEQYNQLRLLNNLYKVANNEEQDSEKEKYVNSSKNKENNDNLNEIIVKDMPKEKENKLNKDIDNNKKEIEKEIGNDLFKEVINLLDKEFHNNEVKFDRELICKKIMEFTNKGFGKEKVEKAVEKIDEIFAVILKEIKK